MSRGIGGYMNLIAADDTILMRFFKDFKDTRSRTVTY